MAVYEKKNGLLIRLVIKFFDLIERTIMRKRIFRLIIIILNKFRIYYIFKLIDLNLLELNG